MQSPDQEIRDVVRSLCQGTPGEQRRALEQYFTHSASFIHPLCVVPSFHERRIPLLGVIGSRTLVWSIFQWYRMLSPQIEIEIDSVLHDHDRDKLFLDMRQVFRIWFVPLYRAPVRLVTVLDLVSDAHPQYHNPRARPGAVGEHGGGVGGGGGAAAAAAAEKPAPFLHQPHGRAGAGAGAAAAAASPSGHRLWKINRQEDLYQANDLLRLTGTALLASAWLLVQLGATAVCVFMSMLVRLSPWARPGEPARGGVEAPILQVDGAQDVSGESSKGEGSKGEGSKGEGGESKACGKAVAESQSCIESNSGDIAGPFGSSSATTWENQKKKSH